MLSVLILNKGNRTPVPPKATAVTGITGPTRAPRAVPSFVTPSSAAVFGAVPVSSSSPPGAGPSASSSPGAGPSEAATRTGQAF